MDSLNKNTPEKGPVETKTLTPQELEMIVLSDDKHSIRDMRFHATEHGGVFKYFEPDQLRTENFFPIVKEGEIIVGIAALQKSPFAEKLFWMKSISIDPKYQGNHYATKLVEEIVKFTKEQGYQLEVSGYTSKDAKAKLERLFSEFTEKYGVVLVPHE